MKPIYLSKYHLFFAVEKNRLMLGFGDEKSRCPKTLKHQREINERLAAEIAQRWPMEQIDVTVVPD